ncbi:cob(I)yrinic acid a,c-diamide adenosyltransferase [Desertibacillus haloalkaliphilus]|uniref:cob(I)yrinic acid a,c-diamide adenosyltransferase n=1 Tax=Desertibacillus haloalkaliphilus TaxID=1328930 RepID=UPI001C26056E|nr:cob(I)yrinic acid a,c-diamide adenosyltransferase [Desertibacillus haloalkaliphilus]MBU8907817.1 cob(I)yrinic acid a,c-diamide adenosyltransferase [Desertibacillus haloalkaliphilus]
MARSREKQVGYCLVYTGNGKGKTTSAIGLTVRAVGRGMKVAFLQFIKSSERTYGEQLALKKLGVEMVQLGEGFTWTKTPEVHREALKQAWEHAKGVVQSGEYDVVVLDELNNALAIERFPIDDCLPLVDVVSTIKQRPPHTHVVITGRDAKTELTEIADLVSTVDATKHYYDQNVPAVYGIEF